MKSRQCLHCQKNFNVKSSKPSQQYCCRPCFNDHRNDKYSLVGQRFGRLFVIEALSSSPKGDNNSLVRCDCGRIVTVRNACLKSGRTKSCGCIARLKYQLQHQAGTKNWPTYKSWSGMIQRCYNPKHHQYHNYGARGITVCSEWRANFQAFLDHVGERPLGKTIDRINVNGNYELGNVKWSTQKEQSLNKRTNYVVSFHGITAPVSSHCERLKLSAALIRKRLHAGWKIEKAFLTPSQRPSLTV